MNTNDCDLIETYHSFLVFDITFDEFQSRVGRVDQIPEHTDCRYFFQWNDLRQLLKNIQTRKILPSVLKKDYLPFFDTHYREFVVMLSQKDNFEAFGQKSGEKIDDEPPKARLLFAALQELLDIFRSSVDYSPTSFCTWYLDFDSIYRDLDNLENGKYFLVHTDDWADVNKIQSIVDFDSKGYVGLLNIDKEKIRKDLDELAEKGYGEALELKGYGFYGGNNLYECDWVKSRDCFLSLMENQNVDDYKKSIYANTLGYIYYYGRCNNHVPEYEKAYKYFSIGAFGGQYESIYKISDMFVKGNGIMKNETIGVQIVNHLFNQDKKYFLSGNFRGKMADIALRMGNFYRDGIGGLERDQQKAFWYYSVARLAIDLRMNEIDYYGDEKVKNAIYSQFDDNPIFDKIAKDYQPKTDDLPYLFKPLFDDGYCCDIKVSVNEKSTRINVTRIAKQTEKEAQYIPFYDTARHSVNLTNSVSYTIPKYGAFGFFNDSEDEKGKYYFSADEMFLDEVDENICAVVFSLAGEPISYMISDKYTLVTKSPSSKSIRIASLLLDGNNRPFDYICNVQANVGDEIFLDKEGRNAVVTDIKEVEEKKLKFDKRFYSILNDETCKKMC